MTAISFFTRGNGVSDLAQVRYVKSRRNAGGGEEERTQWVATVQYVYGEPSRDARVRRWNPLAFKVVDFRPEMEVPPAKSVERTPATYSQAGAP